jgi:hypothetical protein
VRAAQQVQRDHETGKAKGFAFIEFYSHDAAAEVLAQYKGRDIPGAPCRAGACRLPLRALAAARPWALVCLLGLGPTVTARG